MFFSLSLTVTKTTVKGPQLVLDLKFTDSEILNLSKASLESVSEAGLRGDQGYPPGLTVKATSEVFGPVHLFYTRS